MEYICLGIIFGILGGILNSPIFFIIVIILDSIIIICIYFFKNIIKNLGINKKRFLKYIISIIDIKEGKYKNTYTIILKNINRKDLFKNKWKNICKKETYTWERL